MPPSMKHSSVTDRVPGILGEYAYQCCSHSAQSRQQYGDFIIDLYGVKHSTVSNPKFGMPSLSCLLYVYTISISSLFNLKIFSSSSTVYDHALYSHGLFPIIIPCKIFLLVLLILLLIYWLLFFVWFIIILILIFVHFRLHGLSSALIHTVKILVSLFCCT